MSITPIRESRVATLPVTDLPDLDLGSGRTIVPDTVEITFFWESPDVRKPDWYQPGDSEVEISGRIRKKDGTVGDRTASRGFSRWLRTDRPQWLNDLVAEHQPAGWVEDTYMPAEHQLHRGGVHLLKDEVGPLEAGSTVADLIRAVEARCVDRVLDEGTRYDEKTYTRTEAAAVFAARLRRLWPGTS